MENLKKAVRNGNLDRVREGLGQGAEIDPRLFRFALCCDQVEIVELLLSRGANVNSRGRYDWTPLHFSVVQGQTKMVKLLLEHGADVNARDKAGLIPAEYPVTAEIAALLKERGAD